jgi:hypothetical protein
MVRRLRLGMAAAMIILHAIIVSTGVLAGSKLDHAAPSIETLIDQFLNALAAKDRAALHQLRVTESEYLDTILPGTVAVGAEQRKWPENVSKFYWAQMNDKSTFYEGFLLQKFGGRKYRFKSVQYEKGTQQYATYSAFKQMRLALEDGDGAPVELATGSVAEVDGHYKFISFIRD